MKHNIKISHIVKVCEGCGKGGNRQSITVAYAFFSILETKYLIIDNEVHFDWDLAAEITRNRNLDNQSRVFNLKALCPTRQVGRHPIEWSERKINIFKVEYCRAKELNKEWIEKILRGLEKRWREETENRKSKINL